MIHHPSHPMVSVIMPVYNGAMYIRCSIESVLSQTFKDFEIIVIDDGSTDNTRKVLDDWIADGTIQYLYQANQGAAAARNVGIHLAKGKFLKFLDHDDFLYPRQFELQVKHLNDRDEMTLSTMDYELEFESGTRKKASPWLGNGSQLARFIEGNPCPSHSILTYRSLVEKVGGFDESLLSNQDTDLWLRILIHGGVFEKLDYMGSCYRILEGSVSSNPELLLAQRCKVYEKLNQNLLPDFDELPEDVLHELFRANTKLVHMCFSKNLAPSSLIPAALQASSVIYGKKANGSKKFLLNLLGIENLMGVKYFISCMTNPQYAAKLLDTSWRNEQNYA